MKDINRFLTIAALGLALAAFTSNSSGADKPAAKVSYPLDTCVVSGEKLGEMGDAYVFDYKGQEVKLCCQKCKSKFDKDPETYLKKIEEAKTKAKK
jgi:YHS domain-containing protein